MEIENNNTDEDNSFITPVIDENHIYKLTRNFVRIEYPGLVKNVPKALQTLGGIFEIETAISDPKKRLELRFHPDNKFSKPCVADRDRNPGLLIEISKSGDEISYNIIGFTLQNFKFYKAADFQYLPIVENNGQVNYIHDKVFPPKLPTLDFLISKENASQPTLLLPSIFSRYDISHHTLYLNASEKFNIGKNDRPELFQMFGKQKSKPKNKYRQISYLLNINDPLLEIPSKPNPVAVKLVKEKLFEEAFKQVEKLFEERPMWSKAAVQHKTRVSNEALKVVLPATAYFWLSGPWRMIWTKFGVDPRLDFNLRIYQTLDFRIRSKEGTKIKVKAKRTYAINYLTNTPTTPLPKNLLKVDESHYMLNPDLIPPARQMFYQYCDIKIPEIEDMLQRLPKTYGNQKFDHKTGWLPTNFSEQCREIANRYVMERVRRSLIEENLQFKKASTSKENTKEESLINEENILTHSSGMLNQIQKGFKRSLATHIDNEKIVVLTDDESEDEINEIVKSIPDTLEEGSDNERLSDDSEMELDMEAVEEINEIISNINEK